MFDLTGGAIERVWRLHRGLSRSWGITIAPSGLQDVQVAVRTTTDCAGESATCDIAGRTLPAGAGVTIMGPPHPVGIRRRGGRRAGRNPDVHRDVEPGPDRSSHRRLRHTGRHRRRREGLHPGLRRPDVLAGDDNTDRPGASGQGPRDSEASETLVLTLSSRSPARVRLADSTATGTIR